MKLYSLNGTEYKKFGLHPKQKRNKYLLNLDCEHILAIYRNFIIFLFVN